MRVLFDLLLILFLFFFFFLALILVHITQIHIFCHDFLLLPFDHPLLVINLFEHITHKLLKIFELCLGLSILVLIGTRICYLDDLVDNSHNEIVVDSILPVLKGNFSVVKEVICDDLHVIDFLEDFVEPFIDITCNTWRVL